MVQSAEYEGTCLSEVLKWIDIHPLDFEEVVVQKATSTAIQRWQDAHNTLYHVPLQKTSPRKQSVVKDLHLPNSPKVVVDPQIANRVSLLVNRNKPRAPRKSITAKIAKCPSKSSVHDSKLVPSTGNTNSLSNSLIHDVCSTLDIEAIGTKICTDTPLLVKAATAQLYLKHESHDNFIKFDKEGSSEQVGTSLVNRIITTEVLESASVDDLDDDVVTRSVFEEDSTLQSFIAVPIPSPCGTVIGVLLVFNKEKGDGFTDDDAVELKGFVGFCATALSNSQMFEHALLECRWSNVLLDLARTLFENLETIDQVVTNIMVNASALLSCEKCSVFMVDFDSEELFARVFDVGGTPSEEVFSHKEIRFPMTAGIAGHVATTGETTNIIDAYTDTRFNQDIDLKTGFKTKTILCMPIYNSEKKNHRCRTTHQ